MENSLAVKMRPKCFAEVIGQQAIISVLQRQIETNKFKHTYLFCGPSGCGKTTVARIMASEINKNEGDPIEIDAASNNGIDCIRQIISDAQQTSIDSEYKVYIIDECHMLSSASWNAALKLIEEPPSNAIFIFCTTNPNKLPNTVLNRLQRFDFRRISVEDIVNRLEFILNEEIKDCTYEKEALIKIASKSNGFMREAISLLEKCIDYSKELTVTNICNILNLVSDSDLLEIVKALELKDSNTIFNIMSRFKIYESNYISIIDNLLDFFIDIALIKKLKLVNYYRFDNIMNNYIISLNLQLEEIVDRLFKYRQLCDSINTEVLLKKFILEICEG